METWLESHCNVWFMQADSSPHCHNLERTLTDVAWLYPHSNHRVGGMISICSFHVPILGVGRVSAENGYFACSRSRTGSWNWNPGPWLPAQTTAHCMALSIGWCKCHSHPWGWEVDSYLHTRLQTSSCSQALHAISTGKLPKLVRDGGEGGKKSEGGVFHMQVSDVAAPSPSPLLSQRSAAPCGHHRHGSLRACLKALLN